MRPIIQLFGHLLAPAARRFQSALQNPQLAQAKVQQMICARLIASEYGKSLGIGAVADWSRIPIVSYDQLEPWILGRSAPLPPQHHSPLTPEPILFYEKTSGSTGAAKWIPYTHSLRRSFNHMFCVWAYDLIRHGPPFCTGKLYACLSPQFHRSEPSHPQALQDDLDYLDPWLQWLLRPWLVLPDPCPLPPTPQQFQHQLCRALLQAESLEIISVWSPSFLQVQLNYIHTHQNVLAEELRQRISRDRHQLLTAPQIPWTQLWPHLKLISCWDHVYAADQAKGLRSQFPGVLVQGKGLLATEAPMTIPLMAAQGCVPVLDQVFFEFEDEMGTVLPLHQLERGQTYEMIVSQTGGLYRYRMGDRVQVTHWYHATPCLEFVGRDRSVSDLVGEKLHAAFVHTALDSLNLPSTGFSSLVPVAHPPHYLLLLDTAPVAPQILAEQLDTALCQSHHYQRARSLGQLAPLQIFVSPKIPQRLALHRIRTGSLWGGIKHARFVSSPIQPELLQELQQCSDQ